MYTNFALYLSNAANKKLLENENLNKIFTDKENFKDFNYNSQYGVTYLNSFLSVQILNPFDENSEFAEFLFDLEPEKKEYYSICYYNLDDEQSIVIHNYNNYPERKFTLQKNFEYVYLTPDIDIIYSTDNQIEVIG